MAVILYPKQICRPYPQIPFIRRQFGSELFLDPDPRRQRAAGVMIFRSRFMFGFMFIPYCGDLETLFSTLFSALVSTPNLFPFRFDDSKVQFQKAEAAFVASSKAWLIADQS